MEERIKEDVKALVELAIEFKKTYGVDISVSVYDGLGCGYTMPDFENWVSIKIGEN